MTPPSTALTTVLKQVGLATADKELVPLLTQAGHPRCAPVLLEVVTSGRPAR